MRNAEKLNEHDRIYMIMTDRFFDGDSSNNGALGCEYRPGNLHFYQGGDWTGIAKKLDYIRCLGFTAVWISPPQDNALFSRSGDEAGYHGYYTRDFIHTNPHFGTADELRLLLDTADALDLKVILDAQINHTADYMHYPNGLYDQNYGRPAPPFDEPTWYHNTPNIENFESVYERHYYSLGGLDDLAQENPVCWQALLDAYGNPASKVGWISYGFAGVRLDAVMEVPERFLSDFENHVGVPCFGEAYTGLVSENAPFQKSIWGILDFPLHFRMHNVFYENADWMKIQEIFDQDLTYDEPNRLLTFLDNHDRPRFLSNASDNYDKLRMALAFLYCIRGIPIIYYGTEQAMGGNWQYTDALVNDHNRQMMCSFDESTSLFAWVQRLNEIREQYADTLSAKAQHTLYCVAGDPIYAITRGSAEDADMLIGIFNNSAVEQSRIIALPLDSGSFVFSDLLNTGRRYEAFNGKLRVSLPPYAGLLLTHNVKSAFVPQKTEATVIRIRYDCGWGNALYIRGDMAPLCWEHGLRCDNIAPSLWQCVLERPQKDVIKYKALINDHIWETGQNHSIGAFEKQMITPVFF